MDTSTELGFDEQFNDALFNTSLNNTKLRKPKKWPQPPTKMRKHIQTGKQSIPNDRVSVAHCNFMQKRNSACMCCDNVFGHL